jgi:hypothetical protein
MLHADGSVNKQAEMHPGDLTGACGADPTTGKATRRQCSGDSDTVVCHAGVRMALNGLLHALMLMTILATVFALVISKVERRAMREETASTTREVVSTALAAQQAAHPTQFCSSMRALAAPLPGTSQSILDTLSAAYDRPSPEIVTQNLWVHRVAIALVVGVALLLLSAWAAASAAGACPVMWELLVENAITFAWIAGLEVVFFVFIASKFIPVKPSYMQAEILSQLRAVFNPVA